MLVERCPFSEEGMGRSRAGQGPVDKLEGLGIALAKNLSMKVSGWDLMVLAAPHPVDRVKSWGWGPMPASVTLFGELSFGLKLCRQQK